jgi:two-component system, LytTR family, sensor histidine kinase AlgZ
LSKGGNIASTKSKWAFPLLWINLAVVLVLLFAIAENQFSGVRNLLQVLAYALVYANLTGLLGTWVLGGLVQRLDLHKFPLIPAMLVSILVLSALGCLLVQALLAGLGFVIPHDFWREYFLTLRVALPLAGIFGLGALVHGSLRDRLQRMAITIHEKDVAEARAQKLAVEARLRSLESRIHPHFLFNTLNSISALIAVHPARAEQIVGRLAVLLRLSLDTSGRPLIPLREELAMVESYLDIEKVRFGDKLRGSVQVSPGLQNAAVPPMSVQSLVENAVKYGITPQSNGGECLIAVSAEGESLRIEVRDSGPGFDLAAIPAGHGLDNLVERLDALFGAKARLNVARRDGCCVVEMFVPQS